jgi:Permuted papain-like amidase enzyme, YaeF/YiiX, C92 family
VPAGKAVAIVARLARLNPIPYLLGKMTELAASMLSKPIARYSLTIPNDMAQLRKHIRKGDVLLVEGNERVSEVIKYLSQSSWSHAALYVGDEALRRSPEMRHHLLEQYGDEANFMLVEALVESGVVLTPVSKYRDFNIRICRPHQLTLADQQRVIDYALGNVGNTYDLKNLFDLARYFLPVAIVPARLRRQALEFGSTDPTRVICSSMIAESFARVRFPIVPRYEPLPPGTEPAPSRYAWLERFSHKERPTHLLRRMSPTLTTPRDFDLSPYFEIVKFNVIESSRFDYHKLRWVEEPGPTETAASAQPPGAANSQEATATVDGRDPGDAGKVEKSA